MPLLINDGPTAQGFIDAGVAPADAWEYSVIGCNELGIPGRSAESATCSSGSIQYLALLNEVLMEDVPRSGIEDMPALLAAMERRMKDRLMAGREHGKEGITWAAALVPTPFTSALMRGCIARGQDFRLGMDYHLPGLYDRGLTNAANALAAIDHVVFRQRALTLEVLRDALESDLADEALLRRLRAAPKWGNDDPDVDRWGQVLLDMRERVLDGVDRHFGDSTHVVCHVVRSLHRLDGQRIAASPDGRLAGTPVADSIGAEAGTSSRGPTAVLSTVSKIDAARYYRGGYNLNLTLPAQSTTPEVVADLLETFFERGGQELQINCLDAETLRAAQERPELYGDMVVRFAGFSARFVDLSRAEQQELIARAEGV
jgi:formate C-acetyltransferase